MARLCPHETTQDVETAWLQVFTPFIYIPSLYQRFRLVGYSASVGIRCHAQIESFNDGNLGKYGNEVFEHVSEYKPPFHTTDKVTNLVAAISEQIGRIKVLSHGNLN